MKKYILMLAAAFTVLCSCTKEETDFKGTDAHFVSFSLNVEGTEYPASISNGKIIVTVPSSVSMFGASVTYQLSENSLVVPDPATVTEWDDDQVFRVESWNGGFASYSYVLVRQDVGVEANISLRTQADVDALAAKKFNVIEGNLILGCARLAADDPAAADPIKDLSELKTITQVKGNLVINPTFAGKDLKGLHNVKSAGSVLAGSQTQMVSFGHAFEMELPALEQVSNIAVNTDSITAVSIPALKECNEIFINGRNVKTVDLRSLARTLSNLELTGYSGSNSPSESNNNGAMIKLSLPALEEVGGSFIMDNFWSLEKLELPKLRTVSGQMGLIYLRYIRKVELPQLQRAGRMNIKANDGMTRFAASALEYCGGEFYLASYNNYSINLKEIELPLLETIQGNFFLKYASCTALEMPKLANVSGKLDFNGMQFVETISFPELSAYSELNLTMLPMLSSFTTAPVESLEMVNLSAPRLVTCTLPGKVEKNFTLNMGNSESLMDLGALEEVGGNFTLTGCYQEDINIKGLKKVGGNLAVNSAKNAVSLTFQDLVSVQNLNLSGSNNSSLDKVVRLSAPALAAVEGNMSIRGLLSVQTLDFPVLTQVKGNFQFQGGSWASQASMSKTENLDGLNSITAVGGRIDVKYAAKLADFSGLAKASAGKTDANWKVEGCAYNPTAEDMAAGRYTPAVEPAPQN